MATEKWLVPHFSIRLTVFSFLAATATARGMLFFHLGWRRGQGRGEGVGAEEWGVAIFPCPLCPPCPYVFFICNFTKHI